MIEEKGEQVSRRIGGYEGKALRQTVEYWKRLEQWIFGGLGSAGLSSPNVERANKIQRTIRKVASVD